MMRVALATYSVLLCTTSGCANKTFTVVVAPAPPGAIVTPPTPTRSVAVARYSGMEKRPVTLLPNLRVTRAQLMAGVRKSTLLIVVRNRSAHPLTGATQLLLDSADLSRRGYYGKGPLLPGEMRIIKAHNVAPAWVTLVWRRRGVVKQGISTGGRWKSRTPVQSTQPLIFTILPDDKLRVTRSFDKILAMP